MSSQLTRLAKTIALISVAIVFIGNGYAQTITGTIMGTVRDPTGAPIPGAKVTVVNSATGLKNQADTGGNGDYVIPYLVPGTYDVNIEATGFKRFTQDKILLSVDQKARIDASLELGSLSETVLVTAASPVIQTDASSLGQVVDNLRIIELPLNGRNVFQLAGLSAPGVSGSGGTLRITGSQPHTNDILINGVSIIRPGYGAYATTPSVDEVDEFKVQTSNFSAEFGRSGGGIINLVTKTGGNDYHGALWEFMRNDKFDARNTFASTKRPLRYNQFGGTLGGPIVIPAVYDGHNRTFFFVNYEGSRQRSGAQSYSTIPGAALQAGDFSSIRVPIYDPATTRVSGNTYARDPFPDNRIPSVRFDPVAQKAISYYPAPNQAGSVTAQGYVINNYQNSTSGISDTDRFAARVDHQFSPANRLFVRFSWQDDMQLQAAAWPNSAAAGDNNMQIYVPQRNAVINDTHSFRPNLLNEFRLGFSRGRNDRTPIYGYNEGWPEKLGLPNVPSQMQFPGFSVTNFSRLGPGDWYNLQINENIYQLAESLTYIRDKHTLKIGAEIRRLQQNTAQWAAPSGSFAFNGVFTRDPSGTVATSGIALADFLLGMPNNATTTLLSPVGYRWGYYSIFAQEDYKIHPRLTLNLGLRWDVETPRSEQHGRQSLLNPYVVDPTTGMPGKIEFAGKNGTPRGLFNTRYHNFAPRIGFAYRPLASNRLVLRAAYGIFYTGLTAGTFTGEAPNYGQGFRLDGTFPTLDNINPPFLIKNGPPVPSLSPGYFTVNPANGLLSSNSGWVPRDSKTPNVQEWNFAVQVQPVGDLAIEASYAGSKLTYLPGGRSLNQLTQDTIQQYGPQLTQAVPNPYGPGTISRAQALRDFPNFTGVGILEFGHSAIYHQAGIKVEKRYSQGFTVLANYTIAKGLDDVSVGPGFGAVVSDRTGVQDAYNFRAERAVSTLDIPQHLAISSIYALPFGPGKRFLTTRGVTGKIVGGWEVSGIADFLSGGPLTMVVTPNLTNSFNGPLRPNRLRSGVLSSGSSIGRYFDTSAYAFPAAYSFGNGSRNEPDLRMPGSKGMTLGIIKNTAIREQVRLQFRAELFNAVNFVNYGMPGTTLGTGSFGVINSAGAARVIQFGLKLLY